MSHTHLRRLVSSLSLPLVIYFPPERSSGLSPSASGVLHAPARCTTARMFLKLPWHPPPPVPCRGTSLEPVSAQLQHTYFWPRTGHLQSTGHLVFGSIDGTIVFFLMFFVLIYILSVPPLALLVTVLTPLSEISLFFVVMGLPTWALGGKRPSHVQGLGRTNGG